MSFILALKLKVYIIINTRTKYHTAIKHLTKLINLTWRLFVRIWLHITSDSITIFVCKGVCVKSLLSAGFNLLN